MVGSDLAASALGHTDLTVQGGTTYQYRLQAPGGGGSPGRARPPSVSRWPPCRLRTALTRPSVSRQGRPASTWNGTRWPVPRPTNCSSGPRTRPATTG